MFGKRWEREFGSFGTWFGAIFGDLEDELRRDWGHRGRVRFERGDMRYVILALLGERPMHGYEVIRELERRFGGRYTPSPGTVYPTLQMLEDMGYVSSAQEEGKRVYTITAAGRALLEERQERVDGIWGRMGGGWQSDLEQEELQPLLQEFRALLSALRPLLRGMTPEQVRRLRDLLVRTRQEVEAIVHAPAP